MNQQLKQEALKEAIRIADELISKIDDKDKDDLLWSSLQWNSENLEWKKVESVYTGNSGIVLFMAELYAFTGEKKYLKVAIEGMKRVEIHCKNNTVTSNAFFTGRMGVSFVMLRLYALTGQKAYLKKALALAKRSRIIMNRREIEDLINGTAGTLLGYLHLHQATEAAWIKKEIIKLTQTLISKACIAKKGLYWDPSDTQVKGLCGFSHGAAGIGYVFLELGKYFSNKAFFKIAEEAFAYENYNWDAIHKTWPDFRQDKVGEVAMQKIKKAYEEKNWSFFYAYGDMNAWCHGPAGIGLSRIRAWQMLKKEIYKNDVLKAVSKTVLTDINKPNRQGSYTLCHASGGNAEIFIKAAEVLGDKKCDTYINSIVSNLLVYKKAGGVYRNGFPKSNKEIEDTSLFMGNTGIAYFLLRAIAPKKIPSILAPSINKKSKTKLGSADFSLQAINKALLEKQYSRTVLIFSTFLKKEFNVFLKKEDAFSNKTAFSQFIAKYKSKLNSFSLELLNDVLNLELLKAKILDAESSHALLSYQEEYESKYIKELLQEDNTVLLKQNLFLNPLCTLTTTRWNWSLKTKDKWVKNFTGKPEEHFILLRERASGIQEEIIPQVSYLLLEAFKKASPVEEVIKEMITQFDPSSEQELQFIKEQLLEQVKHASNVAILITARE